LEVSKVIDPKAKMAANSGGVEWASIVKPILAASYGSFNKNDVLELVKSISRR
jgi:E3 ubiquitin-protein ligase UBR4